MINCMTQIVILAWIFCTVFDGVLGEPKESVVADNYGFDNCVAELRNLCPRFVSASGCGRFIFLSCLYANYQEGSYSKRYYAYLGNKITLDNVKDVEEYCNDETTGHGTMVYCISEIKEYFQSYSDSPKREIFMKVYEEMTPLNITEKDYKYMYGYVQYMYSTFELIENTKYITSWCKRNANIII